jgi:hypothetical protein
MILVDHLFGESGVVENYDQGLAVSAAGAAIIPLTIGVSGYHAFAIACEDASNVTTIENFNFTDNTAVMAHRAIPFFSDNYKAIEASSIQAASVQYTNTSSVLDLEGDVTACQLPRDTWWTTIARDPPLLKTFEQSVTLTAKDGLYAFIRPANISDFDFRMSFTVENGELLDSYYRILPDRPLMAVLTDISDPEGRFGYYTVAYKIDYETLDPWRAVERPTVSAELLSEIVRLTSQVPQVHCNPLHAQEIWDSVNNTVKTVSNVANAVKPFLSLLA